MSINGSSIKARRKALGISRERLARYADVSTATVKRLENLPGPTAGRVHTPSADTVERIADALGVTVDSLRAKKEGAAA